jgi:dTDP-4-amino-4,6-dideoxygalactose transaminase
LVALGVPCGCGACPELYKEKAFKQQRKELGLAPQKRLPNARQLGERCIMLQVHPTLSRKCIEYTISAMKKVLEV